VGLNEKAEVKEEGISLRKIGNNYMASNESEMRGESTIRGKGGGGRIPGRRAMAFVSRLH